MSVGRITDHGYEVRFKQSQAIVLNHREVVMFANRVNGLYYVREQSDEANIAQLMDHFLLLHGMNVTVTFTRRLSKK